MPRRKNTVPACQLETELALLYDISSLVQLSPPNRETFENLLKLIGKVIDFRAASLFLISPETGQLAESASVGQTVDLIGFVRFDMGMGLSAWVAKEKRPILLNNLRKRVSGAQTRSFISAPMIFKEELIGVINLSHDQPESFTNRDLQIIGIVASQAALAIERMIYEYQLKKINTELRDTNLKLKEAQAKLVEFEKKQLASDMAATINHEINNPLAIISGNAQFLLMTMKNSNPSILKRLQAIDKEASNIAQIAEKFRQMDKVVVEDYIRGDSRKVINLKKSMAAGREC